MLRALLRGTVHYSAVAVRWTYGAVRLCVTDPAAALTRTHGAGLLVRDQRPAATLGAALRISIGTREQNDRLLEALA